MAERKSGPVKPPVIDLKARDATEDVKARESAGAAMPTDAAADPAPAAAVSKPALKPSARPAPRAKPEPRPDPTPAEPEPQRAVPPPLARPQPRLAMPWSAISIAAVGGAILGTVLTYGLVNVLPMPSNAPVITDPAEQLDAQDQRLAILEQRLPALEESSLKTQVSLDATITQMDTGLTEGKTGLAALQKSLADLTASIPAVAEVDLSGLQQQLDTLESRVAAIAAGASSADAATLADSLTAIETSIATLSTKLATTDSRLGAIDPELSRLGTELAAAKAAIAAQNQTLGGTNIGPAIKLPLVVSGLETAFAAGRPFTAELDSLTAILPELAVPASVTAAAATGLTRSDTLVAEFETVVPDILAGRAAGSKGDWALDAMEWAKALLALRPSEELAGDTPEAIVSRLEAAMNRRDFITAAILLSQLPVPMQSASGAVGEAIRTHAEADAFVAGLRAQALAPVATETTP